MKMEQKKKNNPEFKIYMILDPLLLKPTTQMSTVTNININVAEHYYRDHFQAVPFNCVTLN